MGALTFTEDLIIPVAAGKLFKAVSFDSDNVFPKLIPEIYRRIEIIKGNQVKCIKNRIEELDAENFSYKYSLIEGDGVMDKIEKITYEVKFETTPDGGSKNKMTSTYYTKGDFALTEREIKEGKEKSLGMYKVVEGYLLQNPDAYA
ncbi:hypothetical protein Q3G72_003241 [Acer saccharum]|nr:hypothetical protein Q3G72_003241 [Acer saccharum]